MNTVKDRTLEFIKFKGLKEGFTKLTGLKPTDEEFEVINGLCTVLTESSRAFHGTMPKEALEGLVKKLGIEAVEPTSEEDFCRMYGKGEDKRFYLIAGLAYMNLLALTPHRSDNSFKSFERELNVTYRMLERGYKLSLDDRRILLEKAKAATREYNGK